MNRVWGVAALSLVAAACSAGGSSTIAPVVPAVAAAVTTKTSATVSATLLGDPLSPVSAVTRELRDARGRQVLLRGINLSQRAKHPPFTGWLTPAHVDALARLGFDHVRFLLTWDAIEPQDGVFDDAYLDAVAMELSWFAARGIYAVVDMHQDMFSRRFGGDGFPDWVCLQPDPFPFVPNNLAPFPANYANPNVLANFDAFYTSQTKRTRLARAWAHAVSKLRGATNVIGWDLLNEPFPGLDVQWSFEPNELSTLEGELARAIRAVDPSRVIFFEPMPTALDLVVDWLSPPRDPNVAYAPHCYDPIMQARSMAGLDGYYAGEDTFTDFALANARTQAQLLGSALWVGEWGFVEQQSPAETATYLAHTCDALDRNLLSACFWDFDPVEADCCSIVDGQGKSYSFASALARPHPRAVAGTLTSFSWSGAELRVEWDEGHLGTQAPTLVELPLAVFPQGMTPNVTINEPAARWEREPATGRLAVWADPTVPHHVLSVR